MKPNEESPLPLYHKYDQIEEHDIHDIYFCFLIKFILFFFVNQYRIIGRNPIVNLSLEFLKDIIHIFLFLIYWLQPHLVSEPLPIGLLLSPNLFPINWSI